MAMNVGSLQNMVVSLLREAELTSFEGIAYYSHKPRGSKKVDWYSVTCNATPTLNTYGDYGPKTNVVALVRRIEYRTSELTPLPSYYHWEDKFLNSYQIPNMPNDMWEQFEKIIQERKKERNDFFNSLFPETKALQAKANLIGESYSLVEHGEKVLTKIVNDLGLLLNAADCRDRVNNEKADSVNKSNVTLSYSFGRDVKLSYKPSNRGNYRNAFAKNLEFTGHLGDFVKHRREILLVMDSWLTTLKQLTTINKENNSIAYG